MTVVCFLVGDFLAFPMERVQRGSLRGGRQRAEGPGLCFTCFAQKQETFLPADLQRCFRGLEIVPFFEFLLQAPALTFLDDEL